MGVIILMGSFGGWRRDIILWRVAGGGAEILH